jgi:hypothetical protein
VDPFQGLASLILGKLKDSTIALWWKFLFELLFSAVVAFLIVCGVTLVSSDSWKFAIGTGMVTAAVCMTVVFRKETSRLTKGMFVVLPELEANKELSTDLQTIQKPDQEK